MNVAVVGVGRMGRRHVQAVHSLGLEISGICDASPEALALTAKEHGIGPERHFGDLESLLARANPDCLIVATTAPTHAPYACAAAEAGVKYVLCEKPMAVSLDECDQMLHVCRANGTRLAINHQMRFMEQYLFPKATMEGDAFGGLRSVTVVSGNFGLSMNALHYFEMFRFMTGERPKLVTAWFSTGTVPNPRGVQFEDRAGAVRLETATGRRFYLDCSDDQGHGVQVIYAGAFGQIHVDELQGVMTLDVRESAHRDLPSTRYGMPSVRSTHTIAPAEVIASSAAVLRALLSDGDYPSGEDGRLAVEVMVAATLSNERGHAAIDMDRDELPRARVFPWA